MQIQMRVVVAIGAAYFIGYSRGVTASTNLGSQLSEGLNKVGDGLTEIAVELGIEFKKYKEDKEEFGQKVITSDETVEEKVQRLASRRDLFRSDDQIADFMGIPVEDVKYILGEDGPPDIDGDSKIVHPTPEEAEVIHPPELGSVTVPSNAGEPPDQPGSDAS